VPRPYVTQLRRWALNVNAAGVDAERGLKVIVVVAASERITHRSSGFFSDVREQVRDFDADWPRVCRPSEPRSLRLFSTVLPSRWNSASLGFGVERIHVRQPAAQVDENEAPGRARKCGAFELAGDASAASRSLEHRPPGKMLEPSRRERKLSRRFIFNPVSKFCLR